MCSTCVCVGLYHDRGRDIFIFQVKKKAFARRGYEVDMLAHVIVRVWLRSDIFH